ncbi:MAG: TonB-dependent receptor [Saprospiraceae bacterium]|nr:TonB-dependent receptor [Saprospiraceae bacterium]
MLTSVPSTKNNPALRPERTKSLEAGVELKFLNNRLGLDLSVYKNNTVDQILAVSQSTATGFSNRYVNAGELQKKGVEVSLSYAPIKTTDFTWNVVLNWARNRNTVVDLYADVQNIQLASYQGGVTLNATKGELYGTIRGTGFKYLNGQKVVGANGCYIAEADQVIGTAQADWTGGLFNSFTYKGVTLGFLVDVSQGGELYSLDLHYGQGTGLPDYTGGKNDLGNDLRLPLAEGGGLIFPGVLADGTPNTKRVAATNYGQYYYWGNAARNPGSLTVYDASFIKLRELSIAFNLPKTFVNKFANNIAFSLYGRNLFIKKDVPFADPELSLGAGNAQGYLSGAYPTVRSLVLVLK